jgi:hypothetical protein
MARINEVRDGVFDFLDDTIAPAEPDRLSRGYAVRDKLIELDGKRIRIFPEAYGDAERLARRRIAKEYAIIVTIEEPYLEPAQAGDDGPVPLDWIDERVDWVEENVFDPLNESHVREADGLLLDSLRTQTCEVTVVYDPGRIDQEKLFWSMIRVAYREGSEG